MRAHVWASSGVAGHRAPRVSVELIVYFEGPWPDGTYRDMDKDFLDLPVGEYALRVEHVKDGPKGVLPYGTPGYSCRRLVISEKR